MIEQSAQVRDATESTRVMTLYGQRITHSSSIFTLGIMAIVPFGLVSLAVTTRYLSPAEFGQLSILFAIASILTILCGLGFLQGTLMAVYRVVDGDDDGVAEIDGDIDERLDEEAQVDADERRRILGSGFLIIGASGALLCGTVAVVGGLIAGYAFGEHWGWAVCWASASAWAGAMWRVAHQIPRMERKPKQWAALQVVRPALVVGLTVAALAAGMGINGVLIGTTVGSLLGFAFVMALFRRCFIFEFKFEDVGMLWKLGKQWIPLIVAAAVQANAGVLILGILATPTSAGLFQVANRVAQIPNYFADGFLTGWPAMERSPISLAAKERKGKREYSASVFTLFALSTLGLLMATSLLADALIHIAAPSYSSAAGLIPIVAASYGAHTVFRGIYRAGSFPQRRLWYMLFHFIWIAPFIALATILIPIDASYGVAISMVIASLVVATGFALMDKRSTSPTPFHWKRLGFAALVTALLAGAINRIPVPTPVHIALVLLSLIAFPLLLIVTGTVPRHQLATVRSIISALLPKRSRRQGTARRLSDLPPPERDAIRLIVQSNKSFEEAGAELGVSPAVASVRMVRGLKRLGDIGPSTPVDHLIAEYVVHPGTTIERDAWVTLLRQMGVDPLELHLLDEEVQNVRQRGLLRRNPDEIGLPA